MNRASADDAYRAFRLTSRFASLDGLRAAAIVGVIWHHTAGGSWAWRLLQQGNRGVSLFFALSGFLIVTLILRAKEGADGFSLSRFWGRRALRILPMYYAVLATYTVLVWRGHADPEARQAFFAHLPSFLTFTSNWFVELGNQRVIFFFAWSLAAEEQFYLIWPLIERYGRRYVPVVAALTVLGLTRALSWVAGPAGHNTLAVRIPCSIPPAILMGVVLAHLLHSREGYRRLHPWLGQRGSATGCLLLCATILSLVGLTGDLGEIACAAAFTLLVGACSIREDNDLAEILRWRPIAWIGTISYGMYLLHMICANLARDRLSALPKGGPALITLLISVLFASVSYLTFERFFSRLKERFRPLQQSAGR